MPRRPAAPSSKVSTSVRKKPDRRKTVPSASSKNKTPVAEPPSTASSKTESPKAELPGCFGSLVSIVHDQTRNRAPGLVLVVLPVEALEGLDGLVRRAFTKHEVAIARVDPTCVWTQTTKRPDAIVVVEPVTDPFSLVVALELTDGTVVAAMVGDPVFPDLAATGQVVALQVVHGIGKTWTVFALERLRRESPGPTPVLPTVRSEVVTPPEAPKPVVALTKTKTSVLFVIERDDWCFAHQAEQLRKYLTDFDFTIETLARIKTYKFGEMTTDVLVCPWRQALLPALARVPARSVILGAYENFSDADDYTEERFADVVIAANRGFLPHPKRLAPHAMALVAEDGVDCDRFRPTEFPKAFIAGWCGNSATGQDDHKGLNILREACRAVGVPLVVCDVAGGTAMPHQQMPSWYQAISVLLCASRSEGGPNPVLEAMASGRPVITTDVGIVESLVDDGRSGYVVERKPEAFVEALWKLLDVFRHGHLPQMGRAARRAAEAHDWSIKVEQWRVAFATAARIAAVRKRGDTFRVGRGEVAHELAQRIRDHGGLPDPIRLGEGHLISSEPVVDHGHPIGSMGGVPVVEVDNGGIHAVQERPRKPKILLTCDQPGWAFDINLRAMAKYLKDDFDFDHWYVLPDPSNPHGPQQELPNQHFYDGVYVPYHRWQQLRALDWSKAYGSLRSRWFWPEAPGPAGAVERHLVNRFRAFHVVEEATFLELGGRYWRRDPVFQDEGRPPFWPGCPNLFYLTNPVDFELFGATPVEGSVVVSWTGNAKHGDGDVKGFETIVKPACERASVMLEFAEYNTRRVAFEDMPTFYRKGNVTLCASRYEGASNSVLEAMAAGHAVIATDVGNHREIMEAQIREYGHSGVMLVERSIEAFVQALDVLKSDPRVVVAMGRTNRDDIQKRWSWAAWAERYKTFLRWRMPGFESNWPETAHGTGTEVQP